MIEREDLISDGKLAIIAGPCAIESKNQIYNMAIELSRMGVEALRAQMWKPRSSSKSFQGIGATVLPLLRQIKQETGLILVTEIVDKEQLPLTYGVTDIVQIGARNMQNFELLKAVHEDGRPVILKRGLISNIEEWLQSADYIGRDRVILCERGIRTGADATRFTLDLGGALVAKYHHEMPVIGDPSHPAGPDHRELVPHLAKALIASGLDGVMIEVHNNPGEALCDKHQQQTPREFWELLSEMRNIHSLLNGRTKVLAGAVA